MLFRYSNKRGSQAAREKFHFIQVTTLTGILSITNSLYFFQWEFSHLYSRFPFRPILLCNPAWNSDNWYKFYMFIIVGLPEDDASYSLLTFRKARTGTWKSFSKLTLCPKNKCLPWFHFIQVSLPSEIFDRQARFIVLQKFLCSGM